MKSNIKTCTSLLPGALFDFVVDHSFEIGDFLNSLPKKGLTIIGKGKILHIDTEEYDCQQCNYKEDECHYIGKEKVSIQFDRCLVGDMWLRDYLCVGVEELKGIIQSASIAEEESSDED